MDRGPFGRSRIRDSPAEITVGTGPIGFTRVASDPQCFPDRVGNYWWESWLLASGGSLPERENPTTSQTGHFSGNNYL